MLPSQRALFDIPRQVCYFNAASWGPLPLAAQEAARAAVARKARPWELAPDFASAQHERARAAAARLINANPDDVALISSVSYGVATAAKMLPVSAGTRVIILQDDHSSPVLEWVSRAPTQGFTVETVPQPSDGDWTSSVLSAIERHGDAPISLASISSVHWSDGCVVDLQAVAAALRRRGAALLVDATHHTGVVPVDVQRLDPDFLVFPTYKWVLGPYGRAFLYVAKRWQNGMPLEQTSAARIAVDATQAPYMRDLAYVANARRFDMGERDHFISLEMAAIGMETVAGWGLPAVEERLRFLTTRLAEQLRFPGLHFPEQRMRAPHILSLAFPDEMPGGLAERLAAKNVFAAPRLGRLRISAHAYNDEEDVDRFVKVFREEIAR